jgi:hypothetical protein
LALVNERAAVFLLCTNNVVPVVCLIVLKAAVALWAIAQKFIKVGSVFDMRIIKHDNAARN